MPHQTLKLIPGVNENLTPAYNQAGISTSQLIRFIPDPILGAIVQVLGGWTKFFGSTISGIVRNLWAWTDINGSTHLAVGAVNALGVINNWASLSSTGSLTYITPTTATDNVAVLAATTAGSPIVTLTDTGSSITSYDSVFIQTPIAVGGLVLFGVYPCITVGTDSFQVMATDLFGNPLPATWTTTSLVTTSASGTGTVATIGFTGPYTFAVGDTVTVAGVTPSGYNGTAVVTSSTTTTVLYASTATGGQTVAGTVSNYGAVPKYTTTSGSALVTVMFSNHGYSVGSTYAALVSTTLNGVTISGDYLVQSVVSTSQFTIQVSTSANANGSAFVNGGQARFQFFLGYGPLPTGAGYGIGGYGRGGYGTGVAPTGRAGSTITATDWTLDNWGGLLLANPYNGPIYAWDPTTLPPTATVIPQAPSVNAGMFVAMPERQIVAWGSTFNGVQDSLLVRWCDIEDYSQWIAQPTNQAGSFRLTRGSLIVGGIQGPQQGLLWTDLALWTMQYSGQPFVYGFNEVATGCGLIAPKAAGVLGSAVYWMSQSQFFMLSGEGVTTVPCPVWDVVFQDLDTTNLAKIRCAPNSRFGEIAWYYPTISGGGEITNYIKFHPSLGVWDFGALARTAWLNQSVFGPPIGADPNGYLYQHETSTLADTSPLAASFTTGYFALSDGDMKMFVDEVWPDMKWGYYGGSQSANVQITFNVVDFPGQTPTSYGPYSLVVGTTYFTPRMRGRLMSITIASGAANTAFWRLGAIRYRVMPDGKY